MDSSYYVTIRKKKQQFVNFCMNFCVYEILFVPLSPLCIIFFKKHQNKNEKD